MSMDVRDERHGLLEQLLQVHLCDLMKYQGNPPRPAPTLELPNQNQINKLQIQTRPMLHKLQIQTRPVSRLITHTFRQSMKALKRAG